MVLKYDRTDDSPYNEQRLLIAGAVFALILLAVKTVFCCATGAGQWSCVYFKTTARPAHDPNR